MVFQREKPILLWGTADKEETVKVYADNELILTQTVKPGGFRLTLPARYAAEKLQLKLCAGNQTVELNNLAVGEVWIAGGQVSFAEVDYCCVNLYNSAGLPAKLFRIRYSK